MNTPSLLRNCRKISHTVRIFGDRCYKIRLAIASKNKGKSCGARVITYALIENNTIFLITIYDKSEQEDISDKELATLLKRDK